MKKRTQLLGTIRRNRQGNPKDFIGEKVEVGKTKYVFRQQETLMKFQAKPTKEVILYSTAHHKIEGSRSGKPRIIDDYNCTKFGVDIFDEITKRYAYLPKVRRWPLRLFMHLVDAATLNAYVLFNRNSTRWEFIDELSDQLIENQINIHKQNESWITERFVEISLLYDDLYKKMAGKVGQSPVKHCYICHKSGRSLLSCGRCQKLICDVCSAKVLLCSKCNH